MLRKTISIDEQLFLELKNEGVLEHFKNFSELVSSSLQMTMETMKHEKYKREIAQMAKDPMVQSDISEIEEHFKFADGDMNAF